jgi:hypothetical protein
MRLPWVSREQYDAVLAAKDEIIANLKAQSAAYEQRLSLPLSVTVKLPEDFAVQMPAVLARKMKTKDHTAAAPVQETDWASIGENDNEALAREAAKELGTVVPPAVLARTISSMKMTIRAAKRKKFEASLREGKVGTQSSPQPITEADAIEQGFKYIPKEIRDLVEQAERG